MIKVEHIDTWGFEHAIRGMRNPLDSWDKIDSVFKCEYLVIGPNDLSLMRRLYNAGQEHRKYLRQITVSMDITAPRYWWTEFDTYKIGTTSNSCSTMHKLMSRELTIDDFSMDVSKKPEYLPVFLFNNQIIDYINFYIEKYKATNDAEEKAKLKRLVVQLLPQSYNQKRTVTFNYENALNMMNQRRNHFLTEWREFVEVLENLPYMKEITT